MTKGLAILPALVLAVAAGLGPAVAHTGGSHGYASIAVGPDGVRYGLTLWPRTLPSAVAEQIERARAGDVASRDRLLRLVSDRVTVVAGGRRCEARPGSLAPPASPTDSVTVVVEFACGGEVRDVLVRDDLPDVLGDDYHTLARIAAPGATTQFVFGSQGREIRVKAGGAAGGRGVAGFVPLGIEHILIGWDHVLFLLALLLRSGGWLSLVKIITAFTVAHSITLSLAIFDVVRLPDRVVEAVIALSIALVAAENLVGTPVAARRWLVSFGFGLVHGFGFSSVLRELGLPRDGLLLSLLGFNAGVEIGQALVVALAVPLLMLMRDTRWERRMLATSSVAILVAGLVLFVERTFFSG